MNDGHCRYVCPHPPRSLSAATSPASGRGHSARGRNDYSSCFSAVALPLNAFAKSAHPLLAFGSPGSPNTAVAIHSADAGSIRNKPAARTLTRLTEERDMPVVRLLQNLKVTPEESARLVTAYEETLKAFCVSWTEAILLRSWWQQRSSKSASGAFLIRPRFRDSPSRNWEAPSNRRGRSPPRGACDDRLRPELARCS